MTQKSPLLLLFLVVACTQQPETQEEELYGLMEGSFVSERQSEQNPDYYNITLNLAHIWEDREGLWVYAEYGLTNNNEHPYDQRVYRILESSGNTVTMESYELMEPEEYVGKWQEPRAFDAITESELSLRKGCEVIFQKNGDTYLGKTDGKNCSPGLGNAIYAIHQLRISEDQIVNWARGFDASDNLVWGKSEGGYILDKKSS